MKTLAEKRCTKCGVLKEANLENFYKSPYADGLSAQCKSCKVKASKAFSDANPEKVASYKRDWAAKNEEHERERKREYRVTRGRELDRLRNQANPQANRDRVRAWARANPEKVKLQGRVCAARRRARERAAEGKHTRADIERRFEMQKGLCWWCRKTVGCAYHVDHIVPLSRGGSNGPENICISCRDCNQQKGPKLPTEWIGRLL
ncbi:HNH endonuclease [Deinococcus phoenicis]|uniref:HNH endonuclease n=1 Tax=Deinococcus phoenicis TaxID=1476583 RepID=UPI0009DFB385|nr:HNH endonuclease [Deinococcus phoenicis]